jgi:ribulose-phosphate 3-epimerase
LIALEEILPYVDYVLLMSVNPGFGGQSFIESALDKVSRLRDMIERRSLNVKIEIDGGIDTRNVAEVVRRGAQWLVAGSAVFGKENPEAATRALKQKALEPFAV